MTDQNTIAIGSSIAPQIGFGMWELGEGDESTRAAIAAIEAGYRHFDTAQIYGNEAQLGSVIAQTLVPREELFITTKIWNEHLEPSMLLRSVEDSLEKLQTDYVDLLLIHYPVEGLFVGAWKQLESMMDSGSFTNLGVSNFTIEHLGMLMDNSDLVPAVNQIEAHVFLQEPELIDFCRTYGIAVQAYSPLAHGLAFGDPAIAAIAAKHGRSEAQVMLRWLVQSDVGVVVKSVDPARMRSNLEVFDFELDADDLTAIAQLDRGQRVGWGMESI